MVSLLNHRSPATSGTSSRKQILQSYRTRSLLESTRMLIAEAGFDAVTMERVAQIAGITKGGIYLYFRNKDQMIVAAVEEIAEEMLMAIEAAVDFQLPAWERLCQLLRAQMAVMERHRDLLRTLLLDRRLIQGSARSVQVRRLLKFRQRHEATIKAILDEGVARKVFCSMDTERAAFYVNELTISTAQKKMLGLTKSALDKETAALIQFVSLLLRNRRTIPGKLKAEP